MVQSIQLSEQESNNILSKGVQTPTGPNLEGLNPINAMTNFSGQGSFRVNMPFDERGSAASLSNTKTMQFNTSDMMNERFDGSVLSTAHLPGGLPVGEVTDSTLVIVNGFECPAEVAATLGYLRKEGGRYVDTRSVPQSTAQVNPPQQANNLEKSSVSSSNNEPVSNLGQDTEAVIEGYYKGMGNQGAENLMNNVLTGKADQSMIENAAQATGKTPEQVKADIESIQERIFVEGMSYMKSLNPDIDPPAVLKFIFENVDRADLQDTLRQHWNGKLSGWKGMLEAYLDYNVPASSFNKLKANGWELFERDGVPMCRHPQLGEMKTEVALKQRLLK